MGSVKIVGRNDGWLQPTTFEIQVEGQGTQHAVKRRYREFLELEAALRPEFPNLPSMPPRSLVLSRLDPSFLEAREKHLGELLGAAVAADPTISVPALRDFLGLEEDLGSAWTDLAELTAEQPMNSMDMEHSNCSAVSASFECALCLQCFQHPRALCCHMKFAHGWEQLPGKERYAELDGELSNDMVIVA